MDPVASLPGMDFSPFYKGFLTLFCSLLIPLTAIFFVKVRRQKKQDAFGRAVRALGIAPGQADFARDRVTEEFAGRDYYAPVFSVWLLTMLGFVGLFFGADLVSEHHAKKNFVLTGVFALDDAKMQHLRLQSMVVLCWSFLGAFLWSLLHITRRLNAGDLAPSVYFSAAIRFILAPTLSLAIAFLIEASPAVVETNVEGTLPAMAFLIGFFPDEALVYLKQQVPMFSGSGKNSAHSLSLGMIEGLTVFDSARLNELDIDNAQNLATADLVEIMVRTPFSPGKVIDWIGQAHLYLYFKDEIVALRKHQVRNIFDLLALHKEEGGLKPLSEAAGIPLSGLVLVCDQALQDPRLKQLRRFQELLSYGDAGHDTGRIAHPPLPGQGTPRPTAVTQA